MKNFNIQCLLHCILKKIHSIFSIDKFLKNTMLHHYIVKKDLFNLEDKNKKPEKCYTTQQTGLFMIKNPKP
jgi:hypothetical protein